ncbi:hypothetical protein [uncultured Campylobacter sp.]|uniref:hypothetical protein n=1 Tax=uncultured Campylobacter sp. TaxID=218934 RepID=UPI00262E8213|nr:hypothetical protein [uncultured Campylobacter sp.]
MQSLIKILLLLTFFFINSFALDLSSLGDDSFNYRANQGFLPYGVSAQPISDIKILNSSFLKVNNDIYVYRFDELIFNLSKSNASGYYYEGNLSHISTLYYYDSKFEKITIPCEGSDFNNIRSCSRSYVLGSKNVLPVEFSYYRKYSINKVISCEADENFNTDTQQCQKCPDGQSWDPQTNTCYKDCSKDGKINKVGLPDGRCIDCSGEKDSFAVLKCFCSGFGLGGGNTFWSKDGSSSSDCKLQGSCSDGSQIPFINPKCNDKPDQKPDDNRTKPDNPNPDNNKTNPDDPNNPGGGNNQGNNGGNQGNPKPNPNPGNNTNPNPDPKPNPKPGNGNSTNNDGNNNGGGGNKDVEAKFNKDDFNDEDLRKERDGLYDGIKKHINDNLSKFDGIRDSIDQFVKNVQGKGFEKVQANIKTTCPIKKQILLPNGKSQEVVVDYCEIVSPASEISYYAFYAGFAIGGFLLFLKLLIFSI